MSDADKLKQLSYRHDLLLDALKFIAQEKGIRETYGGYITLKPTGAATVALKAIEADKTFGE